MLEKITHRMAGFEHYSSELIGNNLGLIGIPLPCSCCRFLFVSGGTYYGLFLSLVIANLATDFTAYLLVGFDCLVNAYFLIRAVQIFCPEQKTLVVIQERMIFEHICSAIRLKRQVDKMEDEDEKREEKVEKLVVDVQLLLLAESSEIVLPLAYLLCFAASYYGPNALQLGNVKNSYWLYKVLVNRSVSCNLRWFYVPGSG